MFHKSWLLLLAVPFLVFAVPSEAEAQRGKVFVSEKPIKDVAFKAVKKIFARQKPSVVLNRTKDKMYKGTLVAFFKRKSLAGPITLWIYDKSDKASIKAREPVWVKSFDNVKPAKHWVYDLVLDENDGFNKNRTYLIWVGQIVGTRNRVYAKGEVQTKATPKPIEPVKPSK